MRNKHRELEVMVQQQSYVVIIMETWSTAVDGYKLFRKEDVIRWSFIIKEALDAMRIETNDNEVECLW
ncbi:hypothetical protein HGM15179_017008, partial [Zosterops borbonicus]